MNKEELELLDYIFRLAYSECMSDEIFEIGKLKEKILKLQARFDKAIEYLDSFDVNYLSTIEKFPLIDDFEYVLKILRGSYDDQ